MPATITLKNVSMTFRESHAVRLTVLEDIDLQIQHGEFFILVGPSGCGKSTLLRIMSGLERSFRGTVTRSPDLSRWDMSFVFQQFALLPWLTVEENVGIGLLARGMTPEKRHAIVMRELRQLGLERFAHTHPRELSGGMQQRVGIARALATEPKVMFMDEPFSGLDSFTAAELRRELLAIWKERKSTIVLVTHSIEEALELGDRIAVLTPRPGRIKHIVQNHLPRPRSKRTEVFFHMEDQLYELIRPASPPRPVHHCANSGG